MTMTRLQFASLLEPKLRDIKMDGDYPRLDPIGMSFFGTEFDSKKATETYLELGGIGDFQVKSEGGAVTYTDAIQGSELAFTHARRADGYVITQEMLDHDQYSKIRLLERELQIAGDYDREVAYHLVLNNGFGTTSNTAYGFSATGFDGLALFSTAHTRLDGGATQANRPSPEVDLGWGALADGVIQFGKWLDNRGRNLRFTPSTLVVHPNDQMTARELMRSVGKPGTANNEINALQGVLNTLTVSPFLTDTDAWFLLGDKARLGTVWHWDVRPRTGMFDDFDYEVVKRKQVWGGSSGHHTWLNTYGSTGI